MKEVRERSRLEARYGRRLCTNAGISDRMAREAGLCRERASPALINANALGYGGGGWRRHHHASRRGRKLLASPRTLELPESVVSRAKDNFPGPGLYVTTRSMPGHEERVPAGCLVMFRHSGEQGLPVIQLPRALEHNRWVFDERGLIVRDHGFLSSLAPRPAEGFYILNRTVHITEDTIIPRRTLAQLSYSRHGQPILYVGRFEGSTIVFPRAGYKFSEDVLRFLDPAGFDAPEPQRERHLH